MSQSRQMTFSAIASPDAGFSPAPGSTAGTGEAPDISAVVPVYNERECLPELIRELELALASTSKRSEITLVDDGSTDGSADWIREHPRGSNAIIGVIFEKNAGQSAAVTAGLKFARGAIVVTLDADGQNDPADIPALLAK